MAGDNSIHGNRYTPFAELMRLERTGDLTFKSVTKGYGIANSSRSYGGHVYAQAVWAAAQTVNEGLVVHTVTGFFTREGKTNVPFVYKVRRIKDGRRFCTRTVEVVQEPEKGVCFTCTCSFKRDEPDVVNYQETVNLKEKYKLALGDKQPHEWPEAPGVDSPWYWKKSAADDKFNDVFPGLSLRKVDMTPYNATLQPLERRQLQLYSAIGRMPPVGEQANLHACAHLYASDRNSLFIIPNHLDVGDGYTEMASLSHTVVFHVGSQGLDMGSGRWYCQEARMTRATSDRGLHESRIWSDGGGHVASTWQDGLVRIGDGKLHRSLGVLADGRWSKGKL
ncbi:uncharacterized protein K452DRAFT_288621 [Aplosporella prunicola CBS 121167]|uniref:Acyl-CoA thioesterase II n=1 Tax=Aplosporella prunicola CBS 121167 TaxID=1176127 RepID=A0A6A6BB11_9PEZI|nr:uncharacterized protein K452DRAFT_288621 [Aplosporella prunicola CBS 121167]KAF2140543.1 hypothetical protein K452DRAFT_288621 [Aplosporella prunicola CBS 121167]